MSSSGEQPSGFAPDRETGASGQSLLFAVDGEYPEAILPLVCDLVVDAGVELVIAAPVTLPEQTPLTSAGPKAEGKHQVAKLVSAAKRRFRDGPSIVPAVMIGRDRARILQGLVDCHGISAVVTEDRPRSRLGSILGLRGVDEVALDDCDTIIVTHVTHFEAIDSVLVPIARGPHSGMAIDTGLALARQNQAALELLHVYQDAAGDGRSRGEEVLKAGMERVGSFEPVEPTLEEAAEVAEAIIEYSRSFDVTVLGAPRNGRLRQFAFGTIPGSVRRGTDCITLIAHRGGVDESWFDRWI